MTSQSSSSGDQVTFEKVTSTHIKKNVINNNMMLWPSQQNVKMLLPTGQSSNTSDFIYPETEAELEGVEARKDDLYENVQLLFLPPTGQSSSSPQPFSSQHKIYVINMEKRDDKLRVIRALYKNETLTRSEGFDVRKNYSIVQEYVEDGLLKSPNGKLNYGNLGAAIAHMKLWKEIAEGHEEYALILEDDSVPNTNYLQGLHGAVNAAPDFDMINMVVLRPMGEDMMNKHGMLKVKTKQGLNHARLPNVWTSAYLLSKKGASKLLDLFRAHSFDLNNVIVDRAMVAATNDSADFARYVVRDDRYFIHVETDSDRDDSACQIM